MRLRYTLSMLRILKIPGLMRIMKDWQAFIRMHFLYAAYESGLLKILVAPCNREAIIEKLRVKRTDLLDAILEVGLATKELSLNKNLYRIKGKRSRAMVGKKGDTVAAMIQANITYYSDAYRHAAYRLQGGELGDDLDKIGDLVARFSKAAEPIITDFVKAIVSGKNPMQVLDAGCGSGAFLKNIYNANRSATGVGLEIDEAVIKQANDNICEWGLNDRFDIIHGDIRCPPKAVSGPFDLITLFNILYYFHEEDRRELLSNLRSILSPQGVLAVVMNFRSQGRDVGAANLNMVNCSLKGLTPLPDVHEVTSQLRQCGFRKLEVHQFLPGSTFCGIVAVSS